MGHSAPRYAVLDGLGDAVAATLGDRLLATRFTQGEYCFTVRREAWPKRSICCATSTNISS